LTRTTPLNTTTILDTMSMSQEEFADRQEELLAVVTGIMRPYTEQQAEGLNRIARLVELAERISAPGVVLSLLGKDAENAAQDILRAAVILTHAHLEEFLRTMARVLLPEGDEACLNEIPLAGLGGRKQNFPLGKLVQHRGKTVDEVLRASVSEYLERSNYNSTEEISLFLRSIGFNASDHNKDFAAIQAMIERRHQIVHRADRFETVDSTSLKPIKVGEVSRWHTATQDFMHSLYRPLLDRLISLEVARDTPQP